MAYKSVNAFQSNHSLAGGKQTGEVDPSKNSVNEHTLLFVLTNQQNCYILVM